MGNNTILEQSIGQGSEPLISVEGSAIDITISANSYWKFVDQGVNGLQRGRGSEFSFRTPFPNRKMAESLEQGASFKGISLPQGFKDFKSYSYAAAVKLKREGIEPNYFASSVITPEFIETIQKELSEQFGKIVSLNFQNDF